MKPIAEDFDRLLEELSPISREYLLGAGDPTVSQCCTLLNALAVVAASAVLCAPKDSQKEVWAFFGHALDTCIHDEGMQLAAKLRSTQRKGDLQ